MVSNPQPSRAAVGLSDLVKHLMDARGWNHGEVARRSRGSDPERPDVETIARQTTHHLVENEPTVFLSPGKIRALAYAFQVPDALIYCANAVSVGLNPPEEGAFAQLLPHGVDGLPIHVQISVREILIRFIEYQRQTQQG